MCRSRKNSVDAGRICSVSTSRHSASDQFIHTTASGVLFDVLTLWLSQLIHAGLVILVTVKAVAIDNPNIPLATSQNSTSRNPI